MTKKKIMELNWTVLQHPPYSPDLASTDYHLFGSLYTFIYIIQTFFYMIQILFIHFRFLFLYFNMHFRTIFYYAPKILFIRFSFFLYFSVGRLYASATPIKNEWLYFLLTIKSHILIDRTLKLRSKIVIFFFDQKISIMKNFLL